MRPFSGSLLRLLLASFLLLTCTAWGENPCSNGSFEEVGAKGVPVGWSPMGESGLSADAHSGKNSFSAARRTDDYGPEARLNRDWVPETGQQGAMIGQTRGGMEFWYKSLSRKGAVMNIMVIPMNGKPWKKPRHPVSPTKSPANTMAMASGTGSGSSTTTPPILRSNGSTSRPGWRVAWVSFSLMIFSYLDEVGPFLILDGLRIEEDKEVPGERGTLTARIRNAGDRQAENITVAAEGPEGVAIGPLPLIIPNLPMDRAERARLALVGSRTTAGTFKVTATVNGETTSNSLPPHRPGDGSHQLRPSSHAQYNHDLTLECVVRNEGNAILVEPQTEFTSGKLEANSNTEALPPGQSKTFITAHWTPRPTRSLAPASVYRQEQEGEIYLESRPLRQLRVGVWSSI